MGALRERIVAKAEGEDNYDSLIPKIGLENVLTLARADFFKHRRYCKRNPTSPIAVGFADEFDPAKLREYYEQEAPFSGDGARGWREVKTFSKP